MGVQVSDDIEPNTIPQRTLSARFRFTEAKTKAILQECEARKIRLNACVHATCCAVTYLASPKDELDRHYASTVRLSLRPHLPSPWDGPQGGAGLYTGGYITQVPPGRLWRENAGFFEAAYRKGITTDFLASRRQYGKYALQMLSQKPPAPPPLSSEIDISSVGNADKLVSSNHGDAKFGLLEVRDISVGIETLSRQMYCFMWIFRGQLELNLVYNEAFHSANQASRLVGQIQKVLAAELGCE